MRGVPGSFRDSSDTPPVVERAMHRVPGASKSAVANVVVLDWAFKLVLLSRLNRLRSFCRLLVSVARPHFGPECPQFAPAIVHRFGMTAALALIAVLSTNRANALARFFADNLHRERQ